MPALFNLQGIDEALDNLDLKQGTLKAELAKVIRSYFVDDQSLQTITGIPVEELVFKLWGPCEGEELKAKKKNFSSLKSALNKSLKDLDKAGKNEAGIILGRDNVFIVSEERKDDLLKQMGISPNSPHLLHDMFAAFKKFFSENIKDQNAEEVKDLLAEFEDTQKKLRKIAGLGPDTGQEASGSEKIEPESGGGRGEELTEESPAEEVEVLDEELVEEVAGEPDGESELLEDEVAILEKDELEEILAEEEPAEEVEVIDEDLVEEVTEESAEESELLEDEVEILEEDELEEILAEEEPTEEVEVIDEDLVEEVTEKSAEETELLEDEVETLEEDEIEEILAEEEPAEEVEVLEEDLVEEVTEESAEESELLEDEVEILEEDELEEILAEEAPAEEVEVIDEDLVEEVTEESAEESELLEDEVEILEGDELEEVLAEEAPAEEVEVIDEDLVEEVTEESAEETELLEDEVEILEEDELEEVEDAAESPEEKPAQPKPLEVLSKYIEAEEAINQGDLLRETQEEFINQILERFMPKFIKIPAGSYMVGSPSPKGLEQPLRNVRLNDFYLGQSPVTNDLFDMFVRETGYTTDAEETGYGVVFEGRCTNRKDPETGREIFSLTQGTIARHVSGANWRHPDGPGSTLEGKHNHPVVQVSHDDAKAFAAWAGKRLPTEEEWEAAARGASGQLFPWGVVWRADLGNFEATCLGGTTSVEHFGRKGMSPLGIYDLLGNVSEWTSSSYRRQSDRVPATPAEKIYILKGGSWITGGTVTAAWRQIELGKYWANTIGFRCAV